MRHPHWNPVAPCVRPTRAVTLVVLLFATALPRILPAQVKSQPATIDIETDTERVVSYCCPDKWLFFDVEYLFWWSRGARLPPLVTTSPSDTAIENAGVLGEPGTQVLFGDGLTSSGPRSGLHLRAGVAVDGCCEWWLVTDWLALPTYADTFSAASSGNPILARPFYDEAIQSPNSELVSFPGLVAGGIVVDASNDFWSAGIALQKCVLCCPCGACDSGYRLDLLAGYRFLELSDNVQVDERLIATDVQGPLLLGTQFEVHDEYASHSYFHGIELGIRGEWARNRYFMSGELRAAVGPSYHRLNVSGLTRVSVPGQPPLAFSGGLLTQSDQLGEHTDREFAVVPQAEVRVGRRFTDRLSCSIGYTFVYWSQVVRAGEQIDTSIDSSALPSGASNPGATREIPLQSSSFWAQGLTARLEWQY
jgi:hypothetical protein